MKYIVKLNYHYFEFDNPYLAMDFAETAKRHYFDKVDNDLDVDVCIVYEESAEEKEN